MPFSEVSAEPVSPRTTVRARLFPKARAKPISPERWRSVPGIRAAARRFARFPRLISMT